MFFKKVAKETVKATVTNKKAVAIVAGIYVGYFLVNYIVTRQGTKAGVIAAHKKMDKEKKDES